MERKLFRSGNGWALFINTTILKLLKINPETDKVEYQIENDVLKITKVKKSQFCFFGCRGVRTRGFSFSVPIPPAIRR